MLLVAVLVSGVVRMPCEVVLSSELRAAGLFQVPLAIDTRDKIGQTSAAVALGGLRTLVATFLNLRAFTFFPSAAGTTSMILSIPLWIWHRALVFIGKPARGTRHTTPLHTISTIAGCRHCGALRRGAPR